MFPSLAEKEMKKKMDLLIMLWWKHLAEKCVRIISRSEKVKKGKEKIWSFFSQNLNNLEELKTRKLNFPLEDARQGRYVGFVSPVHGLMELDMMVH